MTLPEHLRTGLGQSGIEYGEFTRDGRQVELFDEVLAAVEAPRRACWRMTRCCGRR